MEQTIFEQNGSTYSQQGDYLLPDIKLPDEPKYEIGVWGNRRRQFLKQHHRVKYYNMLTQCTLYSHLADIEQQAQVLFDRLVDQFAEKEGVTKKLKAEHQMLWVQKTNNIHSRAIEIVNNALIFI